MEATIATKYGYGRISTSDQDLALQWAALLANGVEPVHLFTDTISGAKADRAGLAALMTAVRAGDTVVLWRLDRLGRSLRDLSDIAHRLRERGVAIRGLVDGVDTSNSAGRLMFNVLGSIAEYEREMIRERVAAGMKAAKRAGTHVGRRPEMSPTRTEEARRMLSEGRTGREVARIFRIGPATLYRALARWPESQYAGP